MFHYFPTYFLLTNLLLIPLLVIILMGAVLLMVLGEWSFMGLVIGGALQDLLFAMNQSVRAIEQLPFALIPSLTINWYDLVILYLIFLMLIGLAETRRIKFLSNVMILSAVFFISVTYQKITRSKSGVLMTKINGVTCVNYYSQEINDVYIDGEIEESVLCYSLKGFWHHFQIQDEFNTRANTPAFCMQIGKKSVLFVNAPMNCTSVKNKSKFDWLVLANHSEIEITQFVNFDSLLIVVDDNEQSPINKGLQNYERWCFETDGAWLLQEE